MQEMQSQETSYFLIYSLGAPFFSPCAKQSKAYCLMLHRFASAHEYTHSLLLAHIYTYINIQIHICWYLNGYICTLLHTHIWTHIYHWRVGWFYGMLTVIIYAELILFSCNIRSAYDKFPHFFFLWALLLILHIWNSSPLWSSLLRLQCTCCTVPTTSGKLHGSPLVWVYQWPLSQLLSSPQLSHNDSLWA